MIYKIIIIGVIVLSVIFPQFRCLLLHIPHEIYYCVVDTYDYIKNQRWKEWNQNYVGIVNYIGMFGAGKTLNASKTARNIYNHYKKYGKKVRIVSNYELKDVPYIPLVNFDQIIQIGNLAISGEDDFVGTIVLIDEIEMLFSHREFAKFPIELLGTICQSRKAHILMINTCQRFLMCDKAIRDVSYYAIDCKKIWRLSWQKWYDAFEYENATDIANIKPKKVSAWFVRNSDYNAYDTNKMISKQDREDFISNDELLQRRYANSIINDDMIRHPSRKLKAKRKHKR